MIQRRLLKLGAVLLLATAVFTILLIASGSFDPKPIGPLVWQKELSTMTVAAQTQQIQWLAQPVPDEPFSVRLTAVYEEGATDATDSGYGLILGDATENILIAISPVGYATIQQSGQPLLSWQPWPHVHTENSLNEIWLDWVDGQLTVRLNRELIWVGNVEHPEGYLGIYGESFVETAVFDFVEIELFKKED